MHRTHAGHGSIWPAETSGKPAEARAPDQSTLTAERIAELRELLAMATPGRWVACDCAEAEDVDAAEGLAVFPTTEFEQDADAPAAIVYMSENWGEFADNAALIVAMKNALPALLDAAERATRARVDALREAARVAESLETLEAWLPTGPNGEGKDRHATIHGAKIAAAILALIDKPKDAPAPLPAAPVDGGENA